MAPAPIQVALEIAARRSFATAVEWPGWSRSGKTPEAALEALLAAAPRYAAALAGTGLTPPRPDGVAAFSIVERSAGNAGTEFGVPSVPLAGDPRPFDSSELERQLAILSAAWAAFDRAASLAEGRSLRTGPRGGGRSRAKVIEHVLEADAAYLTNLGARPPHRAPTDDPAVAARRLRAAALDALRAIADGREPPNPSRVRRRWAPRTYIRRAAWHALDHAWELEDRILEP